MLPTSRGYIKAIVFCILTLGIYNLYLVHCFSKETNVACADDGRNTQGLVAYFLLNMITFGIYGIIWDCNWINRCNSKLIRHGNPQGLQVSTYLLTMFLFGPLTIGIMYCVVYAKKLYLQNKVNELHNSLQAPNEIPAIGAV